MIQNGPQNVIKVTFVAMRACCFLYFFLLLLCQLCGSLFGRSEVKFGSFWGQIVHWRGKNSEKWMGEILDENADILTSAKRLENACKAIKSDQIWSLFDRKSAFRRRFIGVLFCTLAVVAMRLVLGSNSGHKS